VTLRFTPARLALSYIALGVLALALLAVPLWYGFHANLGTFRAYVPGAEMQRLVDVFHRDGPQALAAAMDAYAKGLPPGEVAIFADAQKRRLAGNLPRWPAEVPDVPGTYGLVIGLGGDASMRVVTSHVTLPDGYLLLMGRESVRFDSLVAYFWYGIAGAAAIVLALGLVLGWLLRRAHGQLEALVGQRTAQLRNSEERYARAMEGSDAGHWDWNIVTDEMFVSERAREMLALPAGALPERRFEIMERVPMHPDDRSATNEKVNAGIRSGIYERDYRVIARPGEVRWLRSRGKVYHDVHGAAVRMTGSLTDITERKLAADALRASEERYSLAMEASEEGYVDVNVDTGDFVTSERLNEIFGIAHGTRFSGRRDFLSHFRFYGNDEETYQQAIRAIAADGGPDRYQFEFRIELPSGEVRWLGTRGKVTRDAEGRPRRRVGVFADITARKVVEEALRASEERYSLAMEASEEGHFDWNVRTDEIFVSAHIKKLFGFSLGAQFRTRNDLIACVPYHPDDEAWLETMARDTLAGDALRHEFEYRILRDGQARWLRAHWMISRDAAGAALRVIGMVTDITERKRAADELRESEQRFRALTELSSDWYWQQDEELRFTYVSHRVADDYPLEWAMGKTRWELRGVTPLSSGWAEHQAVLAARQPFREFEYTRTGPEGRTEYVSISGAPMFDEQGIFLGYQGVGRSITERKRAEEELRALERKLRQAQRLEAMGTLAGGIAHDFNNILGAILGYGEMALRDAAKGSRLRRDLDSIMAAGERGRALVDRVLAFSRSGVSERVPVHVEKVVREVLDLLSAKLPPNITLHAKLHAASAAMQGDATQVHQVLMNLATNASQAMPAGGTLRVSLRAERIEQARTSTIGAITPGDYLVLVVSDTGTGIPAEVFDRIFDPFFTTKEVGTGTGLGLSLVHGIVTELGGAIDVASAVGAGSTFTVYLPRAGNVAETDSNEELALPRGDGQRVLVVDDEEPLVKLATRTLEELGYAPIGFTSSTAALAAFRADPERFDAVITDERMPGMSGSALIREVRGIRDRIPIVLMSGYIGGAVARQARDAGAEEVLKKPLSARDLASSLARVLHS
jgi:PAS domain S-box-containing protein